MNQNRKILIVEDDPNLRQTLADGLKQAEYSVVDAMSISEGFDLLQSKKPDIVVLDVHLPDGTGIDFCEKIRGHKDFFDTPIIMLTGSSTDADKVSGFAAGADQYLTKPIPMNELLMWIDALLRRIKLDKNESPVINCGDLHIEMDSHIVRFRDEIIYNLTGKEFDLLYFLVKNSPSVISRKNILSKLWHTIAVEHLVDTHISNLRKKLPKELTEQIQSVPGKGFRFI